MNFWNKLPLPILALAPLADVTDSAFRRLIAKYSKVSGGYPYVTWTEFVSADGLVRAPEEGRKKLMKGLQYTEAERPIVAQLFSGRPEMMEEAAKLVESLGFDGLDINMGCPDKSVEKSGAGAALIKNPKLAREIIRSAKRGAPSLPVSVKTRLGYNKDELETWLPELLAEEPAVVTVHARTRKEMSLVPARWERVKRAVEIRNELGSKTLIFGNGDVPDPETALALCDETGADGAMLGRAIFGNPNLFQYSAEYWNRFDAESIRKRLDVLLEHTKLFDELLGDTKNFAVMKKHFKAYVAGFAGASELRSKLMETENAEQVESIINTCLNTYLNK